MTLLNRAWERYAPLCQSVRSGSIVVQIILPNVLEEQAVTLGPQYAERLIHHNPQLCLHIFPCIILPTGVEERVTVTVIRSADYKWSLIGLLVSKAFNWRSLDHGCLLKGNHITELTDGGVLISMYYHFVLVGPCVCLGCVRSFDFSEFKFKEALKRVWKKNYLS